MGETQWGKPSGETEADHSVEVGRYGR